MPCSCALADVPPLRRLCVIPEALLPPPGCDLAPHREGVRVVREGGALYFVYRMVEFRGEDDPRPDVFRLCDACARAHIVIILERDLKY